MEGCIVINLMCNCAHVYKIVCIVPCNFQIYKGIIIISVIALESWHFRFRTWFCLSFYEPTVFPLSFVEKMISQSGQSFMILIKSRDQIGEVILDVQTANTESSKAEGT